MPPPSTIRPSASLLILSPSNRLLLLQRTAHLSFALAHVFPGGVLSPSDNSNHRVCALRETFEETGLLLTTTPPPPSSPPLSEIQNSVHSGTLDFQTWINSWGGELLPSHEIRAFTTWITPPRMKRRYEAQMFIITLPGWISEDAVVVGDGGKEVVGAKWVKPKRAMEMVESGEIVLFPPQMYLVNQLAECLGEGEEEGRRRLWERVEEIGGYVCEPRREAVLDDGTWVMGLGKRGDRSVQVLLEVPKAGTGEPRAVAVVKRVKERL
ncbi:hypothetical protein BDD12DRAFT_920736 [Trichophaea hybrida]|nr:hypothetical protein BDD12DRAFT_920736 [Trichophaea hybrida]